MIRRAETLCLVVVPPAIRAFAVHPGPVSVMRNCLLGLMLFLAAGSPPGLRAQIATDPGEGLQPGDVVEVQVWQRDELSGEFTVAPDGTLVHPLYHQVTVTGIPTSQIEDRVRTFLRRFEADPQVVVQPLHKVSVTGSVVNSDIHNLPPGTTVAEAVIRAGGVTEGGQADEVQLIRRGTTTEVDLTDPLSPATRMPIRSGDQILVKAPGSGGGVFKDVILPILQIGTSIVSVVTIITQ